MAQRRLFNSPFEMGLRTLLLLSCAPTKAFSIDRIVGLDFVACYAADFSLSCANLHGINNYKYGEIGGRRLLVREAVKDLVIRGLLNVTIERGYLFSISEEGKKYARKLKSTYATEYKVAAKAAVTKYKKNTDESILKTIQTCSVQSLRG